MTIESCEIIFSVDQFVLGTESEPIYVLVDPDQASYDRYILGEISSAVIVSRHVLFVCTCTCTVESDR